MHCDSMVSAHTSILHSCKVYCPFLSMRTDNCDSVRSARGAQMVKTITSKIDKFFPPWLSTTVNINKYNYVLLNAHEMTARLQIPFLAAVLPHHKWVTESNYKKIFVGKVTSNWLLERHHSTSTYYRSYMKNSVPILITRKSNAVF